MINHILLNNCSLYENSLKNPCYVDKTGLIDFINNSINNGQKYICNSRPRRFGKTTTCNMLQAYYSANFDTSYIFDNFEISKYDLYKSYLNKFNVIHIDVAKYVIDPFINDNNKFKNIKDDIINDLLDMYPSYTIKSDMNILMDKISNDYKIQFIILIDEWDIVFREFLNKTTLINQYIEFLKCFINDDNDYISLVYLTGILPIMDELSFFKERFLIYSMINQKEFSKYIGITDFEVKSLCEKFEQNHDDYKLMFSGYNLGNYNIYCPFDITNSLLDNKINRYWSETCSYMIITDIIKQCNSKIKDAIQALIYGESMNIALDESFNINNLNSIDNICKLLIHRGYLSYNCENNEIMIPN